MLGDGYHESDVSALGGRKALGEGFEGVESVVSAVEESVVVVIYLLLQLIIGERTLIHGSPRPGGGRRLQGISICLLKEIIGH